MPTREKRADLQRGTRARGTKKAGKKDVKVEEPQENSLSKLITHKEERSGRKHNEREKGAEAGRRQEEVPTEGLKTSSILNTHPVSARGKRPYDANTRTDSGRV